MSKPIIEYIAENIETTIAGITVANGYNYNLSAKRPKRIDFISEAWSNYDVIIQQAQAQAADISHPYKTYIQTFNIVAIVVGSDADTLSIDTQKNAIAADIEKALMADIYRGGYATDTRITDINFITDDEAGGVQLVLEIEYRTIITNPYSMT